MSGSSISIAVSVHSNRRNSGCGRGPVSTLFQSSHFAYRDLRNGPVRPAKYLTAPFVSDTFVNSHSFNERSRRSPVRRERPAQLELVLPEEDGAGDGELLLASLSYFKLSKHLGFAPNESPPPIPSSSLPGHFR